VQPQTKTHRRRVRLPEPKSHVAFGGWVDSVFVGTDFGPVRSQSRAKTPVIVKDWTRGTPLENAEPSTNVSVVRRLSPGPIANHDARLQRDFVARRKTIVTDAELPTCLDGKFSGSECPDDAEVVFVR